VRAVGYIRPSAAAVPEARGGGDAQARFEQYCRDRGHELEAVLTPEPTGGGQPASDADQFAGLATRCDDPAVAPGIVLVPDSTHLAGDLDTFVDRVLWLEERGIEVRCTSSPLADPLENGLKLLSPAPGVSERATRVREAVAAKAARGEVLGRTPYGYRKGLDGLLEPVDAEARIVREIFDLYTRGPGDGSGPLGLRRIASLLNSRGTTTRAGGLWSTVSLAGLLRNPVYTGSYRRRSVKIAGNHAPIIDSVMFHRTQEAVARRQPRRRHRTREPYLLAGLAFCSGCGRALHGLLRQRSWRRADGGQVTRTYRYYECPSRPQSGAMRDAHASWRAEELERAVLERAGEGRAGHRATVPARQERAGVDEAVRSLRAAIRRVAAGTGQTAEFTQARTRLRRARAAASATAGEEISVEEAVATTSSSDRDLAHRAVRALVEAVRAGPAGTIEVKLREVQSK
jgi:DNA invertase Pin-like site-specific DNA recombinase